jgi:hypothetical protein
MPEHAEFERTPSPFASVRILTYLSCAACGLRLGRCQLFDLLFGAGADAVSPLFRIGRICDQQVQRLSRILERKFFLAIGEIRIRQAVVDIGRPRVSDRIQLQDFQRAFDVASLKVLITEQVDDKLGRRSCFRAR